MDPTESLLWRQSRRLLWLFLEQLLPFPNLFRSVMVEATEILGHDGFLYTKVSLRSQRIISDSMKGGFEISSDAQRHPLTRSAI
jgi:hypothetical protein